MNLRFYTANVSYCFWKKVRLKRKLFSDKLRLLVNTTVFKGENNNEYNYVSV
ncbi:hypothetical protein D3C75_471140 [compost metagenome]